MGRRFAAGALALAAIWLGAAVVPQGAAGHAGEVHTEPAPAVEPGASTPKPAGRDKAEGAGGPVGGVVRREEGSSREAQGRGPAPVEPETDPTLHFVALGALLLGGGGFLLFRRRRLLA